LKKIDQIKASLSTAGAEPLTLSAIKTWKSEIDRLTTPQGGAPLSPEAQQLKQLVDAKRAAVEQAFDQSMATASALIAAINVEQPEAFTALQGILRNPGVDRWSLTAVLDFKDRPSAQTFAQAKNGKDRAIKSKHDDVMKVALQGIKAVPNDADPKKPGENPSAKAEAELAKARPWIGKIPGQVIFEQSVQEAFADKLKLIHEAADKHKQQEQQQQGGAAHGAAGGGGAAGKQAATPAAASATAAPQPAPAPKPPSPKPAPPPAPSAATSATTSPKTAAHSDPHAPSSSSTSAADAHGAHAPDAAGAAHAPPGGHDPAHAKGDAAHGQEHGKDAHKEGGHGEHHDPEIEKLSQQHQELVALVNGLAASAQAKGIAADSAINVGLTGLGVAASVALTPIAGAAIGAISFLVSRWFKGDKKKQVDHASQIVKMIQQVEDPAEIDKILATYSEGETDLAGIEEKVKEALQQQPPAPASSSAPGKPEHAQLPAGNRTPQHGAEKKKDEHGDEHGEGHGDGASHGGLAHRLHQSEEIGHVAHVAAEGVSAASHGLHHALGPLLGPVAGVISAFKVGLGIHEYTHLRSAIAKKKQVEEQLKAKQGGGGPQQQLPGGGTPPGGKH
jgi:hypothetical protein